MIGGKNREVARPVNAETSDGGQDDTGVGDRIIVRELIK
jgi:hypothetical protein